MQKEQALDTMTKRDCLLNPNQISDISDESLCDVVSMQNEEYCEDILLAPHLWWHNQYTACFSAQAPISQDSASTSEEDNYIQIGPYPQTQQPPKLQWALPSHLQQSVVHTFTGGPMGKNASGTPHTNDGSTPLSIFMLYFAEIVMLLVVQTNRYYHWCMDSLDEGPLPHLM